MKQPKFISGPPGTGKTHKWLKEKYAELLKKYSWDRIVVLSHTNVAAAEIIEAVKKLPELQNVSKEDLEEQICTIHSYCRGLYVHVTKFDKEDHRSLLMSQPLMQRWKKKSWTNIHFMNLHHKHMGKKCPLMIIGKYVTPILLNRTIYLC